MRKQERLAAVSIMLLVMLVGAVLVSRLFHRPVHRKDCMPGTVSCLRD